MKYTIRIKREEHGITVMDVPWAVGVESDKMGDTIASLIWQMENDQETWSGDIIISPIIEARVIPLPKCEIDHSGSQAQYSRRDG